MWSKRRVGVRWIAWLGLLARDCDPHDLSITSSNHRDGDTAVETLWQITIDDPESTGSHRTKGLLPNASSAAYAGGDRLVYAHCDFRRRHNWLGVIRDGPFLPQRLSHQLFNRRSRRVITGYGKSKAQRYYREITEIAFHGPNEKELSYRWRERVWIEVNVFSKCNARHQSGQRLAGAIG